jgi:hypothetical protein
MHLTRRLLVTTLLGTALPGMASAAGMSLAVPKGKVILTVSGKIGAFNAGDKAEFDRSMLEALSSSSFTTSTPWYSSPMTFSGVPMKELMKVVRATGQSVVATALNDYETRIPVSDFVRFNVLLALKRNGKYMPVSDKGPLFIVYPYDSDPELKAQKYYSRSAWQLDRLVVV